MKNQWKKGLSVILCIALLLSCNAQVFAVGFNIFDDGTYLNSKQSEIKSDAKVKTVETLIDAIGKVEYTDACLAKIVAAEKAYAKLNSEQKLKVENYGTLLAARNAYDALKADKIDTSRLTAIDSGTIGNLKWAVYTNGLLEISGSGAVPSYSQGSAPWTNYADSVTAILVRSSVTGIGNSAFYGCSNVANITLPFVGASRDAVGYTSNFGYIFGYTTYASGYIDYKNLKVGDICDSQTTNTISNSVYYVYEISSYRAYSQRYTYNTPDTINTVTITDATQIPSGAFANNKNITKIVLNDSITSIGDFAFQNSSIKDFVIPESVNEIGTYAFYSCTGLTEMHIPNSVAEIKDYTFYNCTGIKRLTISRTIKTIGKYAFYNCSGISKLVIPDKTESIGLCAFANCKSIEEINIPDSVSSIGESAFSNTSGAKKLSIGAGLKDIPKEAFYNCTALTEITVPNTVETIGNSAFYGCSNVANITLPFVGASRDAVGYTSNFGYIFGYTTYASGYIDYKNLKVGDICDSQTTNTISNSVYYVYEISSYRAYSQRYTYNTPDTINTVTITDATQIPSGAFANNKNITKIVLNDSITSIGDFAFQNNPWYKSLTDDFVIDGDNVLIKYNGTKSNVVIPDTVKHIAGGVFKDNATISAVTLPDGLLSIGENTFKDCTNLTAMTIPKSVIKISENAIPDACTINVYRPSAGYDYRSTNRIVLNNSFATGNETYYYIVKDDGCAEIIGCTTTSTELTVPTDFDGIGVNKIGDYGFANCTTLNSITIPANILNIGKYAFTGCTGLVNATIPTTVDTVGDYAFNNCTGLKNVTISEGVQALGEGAFYNCISLIEAVVPDTAKYVGSYAFYNCTSMVTATIGTTAESIGDYTFYNCVKLENIVVGYSVKTIGNYAFFNCALGRVSIPSATVSIGNYAFAENDKMTKATLRKNLLKIGNGAFRNCRALATITIPTTVTSIGIEAFENCISIPKITIPVGVTEINDRAFSNCSSLANVTISGAVTRIGISAFYNNAFENIILPETVEVLSDSAFRQCANLKEITLPNALNTIGDAVFLKCSALYRVSLPDSVTSVGKSVFFYNNDITVEIRKNSGAVADGLLKQQGVHHVILDADITVIGNDVFDSCYKLSTVTYGNETVNPGEYKLSPAIKTIGSEVFRDNAMLRNLIVPDTLEKVGENAFYNVIQSGYHCKNVTVTFYYVGGAVAANILDSQYVWHIVVNDNIHTLGDKAFYNIQTLETVSLPDTISSVGSNVFAKPGKKVTAIFRGVDRTIDAYAYNGKTSGICYIAVEEGVNCIGEYAFANSDTVQGIVIINTTTIGNHAFYQGSALNYVEISCCNTIEDYAFAENLLLKRVEIDSVKNINEYAFFDNIAINDLYIDADLYHIGNHAFDSCKSIPQVVLPETVREIGSHAFYDCNSMKSINIPVGVAAIKEYTFFGCASLLDISIPNTVLSVGNYAYYGCVAAKALDLSDKLESIGAYAFYNCNQIKEIILPNTLKSIGDYAFRSCSSITEIYIPDSVTNLGDCVFYACTGLEKAEFGSGITKIGNSEFYGCVKFKELMLNGYISYIHELAFYGAEDAVIYSYKNPYVENYCEENGLEYRELTTDFTISLIPPIKTEYSEFEELNLNGLTLNITYKNGVKRVVTTGYTVIGYDSSAIGTQTVTVTYRGVSASFDVNVIEKEISYITSSPSEIFAYAGDTADSLNISVILHFIDGTSREITSGFEIKNNDPLTVGTVYIPIVYKGHTTTAKIVVNYRSGDINGDGTIDIRDLIRLKKILSGQEEDSGAPSDIDGNGTVDAVDLTELKKLLMNAVYKN